MPKCFVVDLVNRNLLDCDCRNFVEYFDICVHLFTQGLQAEFRDFDESDAEIATCQ